jgi:protein phosphatase
VREINEDAVIARPDLGLFAVADGMGGHFRGDYASSRLVNGLAAAELSRHTGIACRQLRHRAGLINNELLEESSRQGGGVIGTTLVACLVRRRHLVLLWAGDSRAYLMRDGELYALTYDHSQIAEAKRKAAIDGLEPSVWPSANFITRAVGVEEELVLDSRIMNIEAGDRLLLCSDGLTNELSDQDLAPMLGETAATDAAPLLVEKASGKGAKDNVSAVVVELT